MNTERVADSELTEKGGDVVQTMSNQAEREMIRMRQDAQNDWITMMNSERRDGMKAGKILSLADLVKDGILTIEAAAQRANMTVQEFAKEAASIKE